MSFKLRQDLIVISRKIKSWNAATDKRCWVNWKVICIAQTITSCGNFFVVLSFKLVFMFGSRAYAGAISNSFQPEIQIDRHEKNFNIVVVQERELNRLTHSCLTSSRLIHNPCIDQSKQISFSLIILFFTSYTNLCIAFVERLHLCLCVFVPHAIDFQHTKHVKTISTERPARFRSVAFCLRSRTQVLIKLRSLSASKILLIFLERCKFRLSNSLIDAKCCE